MPRHTPSLVSLMLVLLLAVLACQTTPPAQPEAYGPFALTAPSSHPAAPAWHPTAALSLPTNSPSLNNQNPPNPHPISAVFSLRDANAAYIIHTKVQVPASHRSYTRAVCMPGHLLPHHNRMRLPRRHAPRTRSSSPSTADYFNAFFNHASHTASITSPAVTNASHYQCSRRCALVHQPH